MQLPCEEVEIDLVSRLREGDGEAQKQLVLKYGPPLLRMVKQMGTPMEDAEEVVNEAFYQIILSIDSYRPKKGNFETWIRVIAKNKQKDWYRKKHETLQGKFEATVTQFDDLSLWDQEESNPAEEVGQELTSKVVNMNSGLDTKSKHLLKSVIDTNFNDKQRTLIELRFVSQLELHEIYKIMVPDMYPTESSVRTSLNRIKSRIIKVLSEIPEFKKYFE